MYTYKVRTSPFVDVDALMGAARTCGVETHRAIDGVLLLPKDYLQEKKVLDLCNAFGVTDGLVDVTPG